MVRDTSRQSNEASPMVARLGVLAFCLAAWACGGDGMIVGACDLAICDDGLICTTDACAKDGSCTHTPRAGSCDDGNSCTGNDACAAGLCAGVTLTCDDKVTCTLDSCDPKKACVHIPGDPTVCNDDNVCTDDACEVIADCVHVNNKLPCSDGNACTLGDTCNGGSCLPGSTTVACDDKDPCTDDLCITATGTCSHLANSGPCDDGDACTKEDLCGTKGCVGTLDCSCAIATGEKLPAEDCSTPVDDNCDGLINEVAVCGATVYKFSAAPECGATCYYDEPHNVAVNGLGGEANNSGFATFANGQLLDGITGADDWSANLGKGPAYEWVAWTAPLQILSVQFAKPRNLTVVRLGLNNRKDGSVSQPPEVQIRLSMDGVKWLPLQAFTMADGSEPTIPTGKRGDITLPLTMQTVQFVEIRFVTPGSWTFLDEMAFD